MVVYFCLSWNRMPYNTQGLAAQFQRLEEWSAKGRVPLYLWLYHCFPRERADRLGKWHCFPGFFAHELGHFYYGHIWKLIATSSVLTVAGFYIANLALTGLLDTFAYLGLRDVADVAAFPLLILSS